jgi:hypothetical protein
MQRSHARTIDGPIGRPDHTTQLNLSTVHASMHVPLTWAGGADLADWLAENNDLHFGDWRGRERISSAESCYGFLSTCLLTRNLHTCTARRHLLSW